METVQQNNIIIGQGSFDNVLKRIGSNKSNVLCLGNDPLTQSGIIVSKGKIVSSRILDITIHPVMENKVTSPKDTYLNKITIKYVDAIDKRIKNQEFDILNSEALTMLIKNLMKFNQFTENQQNLIEKVEKINDFSLKNDENLIKIQDKIYYIEGCLNNTVNDIKFNKCQYKEFNEIQISKKVLGEDKLENIEIIDKDKFYKFKMTTENKLIDLEKRLHKIEENIIF